MIGILILLYYAVPLSILPSFEGPNSGVYGAEINGQLYLINSTLPEGYRWGSRDIHNAQLYKRTYWLNGEGGVEISISNPSPVSSQYVEGKKVDYWVKDGDEWVHVVGKVCVYEIDVSVKALNTGALNQERFSGERFWLAITSTVWNRAFQVQDYGNLKGEYGQAWEAPLALYIEDFTLDDQGSPYASLEPSYRGRFITLYSSPGWGTIDDLGVSANHDLNATLYGSNPLAPDSRMRQTAYFPITLSSWGVGEPAWGFGMVKQAPVATYKLTLYTLQLGKYTYKTPEGAQPAWEEPAPESQDPFVGLHEWFNNPFNIAGLSIFFWTLLIAMFALVLFWFFGMPKVRR